MFGEAQFEIMNVFGERADDLAAAVLGAAVRVSRRGELSQESQGRVGRLIAS